MPRFRGPFFAGPGLANGWRSALFSNFLWDGVVGFVVRERIGVNLHVRVRLLHALEQEFAVREVAPVGDLVDTLPAVAVSYVCRVSAGKELEFVIWLRSEAEDYR